MIEGDAILGDIVEVMHYDRNRQQNTFWRDVYHRITAHAGHREGNCMSHNMQILCGRRTEEVIAVARDLGVDPRTEDLATLLGLVQ
ncbi:MAG: hypothetical protein WCJ29_01915 [bacterium]